MLLFFFSSGGTLEEILIEIYRRSYYKRFPFVPNPLRTEYTEYNFQSYTILWLEILMVMRLFNFSFMFVPPSKCFNCRKLNKPVLAKFYFSLWNSFRFEVSRQALSRAFGAQRSTHNATAPTKGKLLQVSAGGQEDKSQRVSGEPKGAGSGTAHSHNSKRIYIIDVKYS